MVTSIFFIVVVLCAVVLIYLGAVGIQKALSIYMLWCLLISFLAANHFFLNTNALPPRMLFVIIPAFLFVIYCYHNFQGKAKNIYLLMIHVLRVPVEIILFQLYKDGQVPQIMTFQGWNLDIITGITAVPFLLILLLKRSLPEKAFRLWNIFGIILLGIIVTTAILSAPSPLQILAYEHPNLAILNFPYTLLPATVVPIALLSHLLLLRDHHKITD